MCPTRLVRSLIGRAADLTVSCCHDSNSPLLVSFSSFPGVFQIIYTLLQAHPHPYRPGRYSWPPPPLLFEPKAAESIVGHFTLCCACFYFPDLEFDVICDPSGRNRQITKSSCDTAPYYASYRPRLLPSGTSPPVFLLSGPLTISVSSNSHLGLSALASAAAVVRNLTSCRTCRLHNSASRARTLHEPKITAINLNKFMSQWLSPPYQGLSRRGMDPMANQPSPPPPPRPRRNHNLWLSRPSTSQIHMQAHLRMALDRRRTFTERMMPSPSSNQP